MLESAKGSKYGHKRYSGAMTNRALLPTPCSGGHSLNSGSDKHRNSRGHFVVCFRVSLSILIFVFGVKAILLLDLILCDVLFSAGNSGRDPNEFYLCLSESKLPFP